MEIAGGGLHPRKDEAKKRARGVSAGVGFPLVTTPFFNAGTERQHSEWLLNVTTF